MYKVSTLDIKFCFSFGESKVHLNAVKLHNIMAKMVAMLLFSLQQ